GQNARRDGDSDSGDRTALGVTVAPLTPELAARLGASKDAHGLVVEDVNPDGRAADAGIRSGDVIEQVNRRPVESVDDLRSAIKKMATVGPMNGNTLSAPAIRPHANAWSTPSQWIDTPVAAATIALMNRRTSK